MTTKAKIEFFDGNRFDGTGKSYGFAQENSGSPSIYIATEDHCTPVINDAGNVIVGRRQSMRLLKSADFAKGCEVVVEAMPSFKGRLAGRWCFKSEWDEMVATAATLAQAKAEALLQTQTNPRTIDEALNRGGWGIKSQNGRQVILQRIGLGGKKFTKTFYRPAPKISKRAIEIPVFAHAHA